MDTQEDELMDHYMKFIELEEAGKMEEANEYFKKNIPIPASFAKSLAEVFGETYLQNSGFRVE
jgi:hypothetical protein